MEHAILMFSANVNHSSNFAVCDSVANGVFNQGLKEKLRDQRVERRRIDPHPDGQTILKTDLFNFQISFENFQFLPEPYFVRRISGQCDAQQVAELEQHPIGRVNVLSHQHRNAVKRVEKEMRMQLHSQGVELRLYQTSLEIRRQQFSVSIPAIIIQSLANTDNRPVKQHSAVKLRNEETPRRFDKRPCLRNRAEYQSSRDDENEYGKNVENRSGESVYSNRTE